MQVSYIRYFSKDDTRRFKAKTSRRWCFGKPRSIACSGTNGPSSAATCCVMLARLEGTAMLISCRGRDCSSADGAAESPDDDALPRDDGGHKLLRGWMTTFGAGQACWVDDCWNLRTMPTQSYHSVAVSNGFKRNFDADSFVWAREDSNVAFFKLFSFAHRRREQHITTHGSTNNQTGTSQTFSDTTKIFKSCERQKSSAVPGGPRCRSGTL